MAPLWAKSKTIQLSNTYFLHIYNQFKKLYSTEKLQRIRDSNLDGHHWKQGSNQEVGFVFEILGPKQKHQIPDACEQQDGDGIVKCLHFVG